MLFNIVVENYPENILKNKMIKKIIESLLLDRKITIQTLNKYLPIKFVKLFPKNLSDPNFDKYGDSITNEYDLVNEMKCFGLKKIRDIDNIVEDNLIEMIQRYELKLNYLSLMRLIMITSDFNMYFNALNKLFVQWDLQSLHCWNKILLHYKITPDIIDKKIKEQKIAEKLTREKSNN